MENDQSATNLSPIHIVIQNTNGTIRRQFKSCSIIVNSNEINLKLVQYIFSLTSAFRGTFSTLGLELLKLNTSPKISFLEILVYFN